MNSITDNRGYNQVWAEGEATRIRAERRCDQMLALMDLERDISVMEIGCGLGTIAHSVASKSGKRVLGTDLCEPFIEAARRKYARPGLRYEVLDFNQADDFRGETFDHIIGNGILHHLYHQLDDALLNLNRLLKAGGRLIFFEPNLYNPYVFLIFSVPPLRRLARLEPAEMAFSRPFITQKLRAAGFRNIHVEFKDFLLPGIPELMIRPSILAGNVLERTPLLKRLAQSLFITADK